MGEWSAAAILPTARKVARELDGSWSASEPEHGNGVYLNGPDNVRLHITHVPAYGGAGDRYEIRGAATRDENGQHRYNDQRPKSITVSASKSAAQIAGDISRRLLPAHVAYVKVQRERLQAHNEYEGRVRVLRDELLAALGAAGSPLERDDTEIYLHLTDGYGSMRVSDRTVNFNRFSVPGDVAVKIARVLAKEARRQASDNEG